MASTQVVWRTDRGNDTGDSKVDRLNNAQTNQNYHSQNPADQYPPAQPSGNGTPR
jgi:hypothetical protein